VHVVAALSSLNARFGRSTMPVATDLEPTTIFRVDSGERRATVNAMPSGPDNKIRSIRTTPRQSRADAEGNRWQWDSNDETSVR